MDRRTSRVRRAVAALATCLALTLGVASVAAPSASAQPGRELSEAIRQAMEAYNNLDIEQARDVLERAVQGSERAGLAPGAMAQAYMNLGVIYVGGLGDRGRGMSYFVKAVEADPSVQLDPLVSTPDIQQAFSLARRQASAGPASPPQAAQPAPRPSTPSMGMSMQTLRHDPPVEQLSQTAVPIYVEAGGLDVASMRLFYRSTGMPQPSSVDMERAGEGWAYEIPCTDVFEPSVEYFVTAYDGAGTPLGSAGTPQAPLSVPVVSERSGPAPSLPGRPAPTQCGGPGDSECPPGMPGCEPGQMGDTCRTSADCGEGLMCADNFCSIDDGEGGGSDDYYEEEDDVDFGPAPRFFVQVGFTVGAAYITQNMRPDSQPPLNLGYGAKLEGVPLPTDNTMIGDVILDGSNIARRDASGMLLEDPPGRFIARDDAAVGTDPMAEGYIPPAPYFTGWRNVAVQQAATSGWDSCYPVQYNEDDARPFALKCEEVAVARPGLVPTAAVRATAGYYITPRIAGAGTVRFQYNHGLGTLSSLLFGGRVSYLVTDPAAQGLHASLLVGASVGQIQAQPELTNQDGNLEGPYVAAGLGGMQFGGTLGYRFTRNVGLFATPELHFLLPAFMFNLDMSMGLEMAF